MQSRAGGHPTGLTGAASESVAQNSSPSGVVRQLSRNCCFASATSLPASGLSKTDHLCTHDTGRSSCWTPAFSRSGLPHRLRAAQSQLQSIFTVGQHGHASMRGSMQCIAWHLVQCAAFSLNASGLQCCFAQPELGLYLHLTACQLPNSRGSTNVHGTQCMALPACCGALHCTAYRVSAKALRHFGMSHDVWHAWHGTEHDKSVSGLQLLLPHMVITPTRSPV